MSRHSAVGLEEGPAEEGTATGGGARWKTRTHTLAPPRGSSPPRPREQLDVPPPLTFSTSTICNDKSGLGCYVYEKVG